MGQSKTKMLRKLLTLLFLVLICGGNLFAEGQTNFNKKFFDEIEPIKVKEQFAIALGAMDKDELLL